MFPVRQSADGVNLPLLVIHGTEFANSTPNYRIFRRLSMQNRTKVLPVLLALVFTCLLSIAAGAAPHSDDGFMPVWQTGQSWVIEAKYRNLNGEGPEWLPPLQWRFSVRNQKVVNGQSCFVVHVTPENRTDLKVQAILCVSEKDLHPVQVVTIMPREGRAVAETKDFEPGRLTPLFSEGALIPYDLPMFPLQAREDRKAAAVAGENAHRVDDLVFVEPVDQTWKTTDDGAEIRLDDGTGRGELIQTWKQGMPWASEIRGRDLEARLIESSVPSGR